MGFQKQQQEPVKTYGFPKKPAETCKNTLVSNKKQQKLVKNIGFQKKQQEPVKTHGFPKKTAGTFPRKNRNLQKHMCFPQKSLC